MPSKKNERNGYQCKKCGHIILTVNSVDGVTPFIIQCVSPVCTGTMSSWFYCVHPVFGEPTYRWVYRSDDVSHLDLEKIPMHDFDPEKGAEMRRGIFKKIQMPTQK